MPQAGKLDRRITIERAVVTYDALNNPVYDWKRYLSAWASQQDVSDGERIAAAQIGADITTRFRVRYSEKMAGVNPKDRIAMTDGRLYDIAGVKEVDRRQLLEITAKARID